MAEQAGPDRGRTDIAAVAAAIVAAAVAVMVQPGPFTELNAILGAAIVGVLLSYGWRDKRSWSQSSAFAAIVGFSLLLPSGFVAEHLFGPPGLEGIWICPPPETPAHCFYESAVPTWFLSAAWLGATVVVAAFDRWNQRA